MARRRLTPANPGNLGAPPSAPAQQPTRPTVMPPIAQVSGQSAEAAALRELTLGLQAARDEGRMVVDIPLQDVDPGYLTRDRIALDSEEIAALKASIQAHGQRSPAEITPLETAEGTVRFGLISGWRRLRALSELHRETGQARFATLRALIRPPEEAAQSYVAMVEENEIRVGLSYYERARLVAEAAARGVFEDQSAALRTLFATASRAKRSKIGSFIDIHEALGDLLRFPADIPERLGLALVARLRLGAQQDLRAALQDAQPPTAAAELALLEQLARGSQAPKQPAALRTEALRPGVDLALKRAGKKITVTLSGAGVDAQLLEDVHAVLQRLAADLPSER